MERHVDQARVRAARIEGASRRVVDQLRRAEREQPAAVAGWREQLSELAAAVQALAAVVDGAPPLLS